MEEAMPGYEQQLVEQLQQGLPPVVAQSIKLGSLEFLGAQTQQALHKTVQQEADAPHKCD